LPIKYMGVVLATLGGGATQVEDRFAIGSFASWTIVVNLSCGNEDNDVAELFWEWSEVIAAVFGLLFAFLSGMSSEKPRGEDGDDRLSPSALTFSLPVLDPRVYEFMR